MAEILIFILAAMMIGGYNDNADKRDLNRGVHKPLNWEKYEVR